MNVEMIGDVYSRLSTADENIVVVKAVPTNLYSIYATNTNGSARWLKLYNKATDPSAADTPLMRIMIPGGSTGAGCSIQLPRPIRFDAGLAIRIVTGAADNDATAPAANEVAINIGYRGWPTP